MVWFVFEFYLFLLLTVWPVFLTADAPIEWRLHIVLALVSFLLTGTHFSSKSADSSTFSAASLPPP